MGQSERRLRYWQLLTVVLLVVGYAGYYLCRSNLSVVTPQLMDELARQGFSRDDAKARIGYISSLAVLAYALGKLVSGPLVDRVGGRPVFLAGMGGAVLFTVLFALSGALPLFTLFWMGNRLVQSVGWGGVVKIAGRWFSYAAHGTILAVLSLSYLFGDALARGFMGTLLAAGLSWRGLFFVNAAVLAGWFVLTWLLLRESATEVGAAEPAANPANVYAAEEQGDTPSGVWGVVGPLLARPAFWCVCLLSLAMTLIREAFNNWTPTYLNEVLHVGEAKAATLSFWFPFMGGVSALAAGFLGDRLGRYGRAAIMLAGLAGLGFALWRLAAATETGPAVVLIGVAGFLLIGPYAYLAGAVSLDFGGKRGGATAANLIDGAGYLAAFFAGGSVAQLSNRHGWPAAFRVLAGAAWVGAAVAAVYLLDQVRTAAGSKKCPPSKLC